MEFVDGIFLMFVMCGWAVSVGRCWLGGCVNNGTPISTRFSSFFEFYFYVSDVFGLSFVSGAILQTYFVVYV